LARSTGIPACARRRFCRTTCGSSRTPRRTRGAANPLVAGEFGLKFYAGAPLKSRDGYNLGTLCILDYEPRVLDASEATMLGDLAAVVMNDLEQRLEIRTAQSSTSS
jgi:GAF domain-containing protein